MEMSPEMVIRNLEIIKKKFSEISLTEEEREAINTAQANEQAILNGDYRKTVQCKDCISNGFCFTQEQSGCRDGTFFCKSGKKSRANSLKK